MKKRLPGRPRRLGARRPGPGQRRLARRHTGLRRALGGPPAHHPHRLGPRGRAARGPDGQLGGRPHEPRRRRGGQAGPASHRRVDRGRQLLRERGAAGCLPDRAPPPARPRLRRRRAREHAAPARADRAGRPRGRRGRRAPRVHGRPRHAAALGGGLRRGGRELGRLARCDRERPLLRDGPRPALGPHEARLGRDRARPRRARSRQRRGRRERRLRARGDGRVHRADAGRRGGAGPRRRQRDLLQLPP